MNTKIDDIIIDQEFQALIPPLKAEEYASLESSIVDNGFDPAYPIILWDKTIIDGHNRYDICTKHTLKFTTIKKKFDDKSAVLDWIYNNQLNRRNIDSFQKTYLIGMQYKNSKKMHGGDRKSNPQSEDLNKTSEKIGKQNNVGHSTVERAEQFADDVNAIANKSGNEPQKVLSILYSEVKSTRGDVKDVAELEDEGLKTVLEWVEQRKFKTVKEAVNEYKIQNGERTKPKDKGAETEEQPAPQKNAHGVYNVLPVPLETSIIRVQKKNIYAHDNGLQCDVEIGNKVHNCHISPVQGEKDTFRCKYPNIENLIVDFRAVFPSMIAFISDLPNESEDVPEEITEIYFTVIFHERDWNTFVEKDFPTLVIPKSIESQEVIKVEVKEAVNVKKANDKAKSKKQDTVTAKPTNTDEVASKTGATKKKPRKEKAPQKEKSASEIKPKKEPSSEVKSKPPQNKVAPSIYASLKTLNAELGLGGYPKTVDWLLEHRKIDVKLVYEKEKYTNKEAKTVTFNFDGKAKITQLKEENNITIDEVLWRLIHSQTTVMSPSNQSPTTKQEA